MSAAAGVIGIVAALPGELAPLAKRLDLRRGNVPNLSHPVLTGAFAGPDGREVRLVAACTGMGADAATRAFSQVLAASQKTEGPLEAVISYGWAGALSCGVKPPEVFAVAEVIDARTGERFFTGEPAPTSGAPLRLVTLGHVARMEEKRPLAERYKAVLVDMEAATVARLARAHSIQFRCITGVSDGYTDVLPDFNPYLDAHGQLRMAAFVAGALTRPRYWPALARMGGNSRAAARELARRLPVWVGSSGLVS